MHSSICFYFAGAFQHSGQPGFQLLLVRSSFFGWKVFVWFVMTVFFFHLCLLSLSVLSSKERLHIRLVLLGNPCKTNQHQSVGKRWNESPFSLPSERLTHRNMQQILTILKVLTGYRLAKWKEQKPKKAIMMKVQRLPPSARRNARQDMVTMESGTILRAFGTIYVIRKRPPSLTGRLWCDKNGANAGCKAGRLGFTEAHTPPVLLAGELHKLLVELLQVTWPYHQTNKQTNAVIIQKILIPKTIGNIGNRKRDCVWGCARGIDTTWENMQIEKHKSVRWTERTPSWFVLFDLQIFSGGVYPPSATSRTISFSISNSFWY